MFDTLHSGEKTFLSNELAMRMQMNTLTQQSTLIPSNNTFRFRDDINGLRALAVLGVVLFHADRILLPGGFTGVDIFFVISGFLISRIIFVESLAGHFSLTDFYAKRAKRILPALLVVLACVVAYGWKWADPFTFRETGSHLLGNSYFTVNFWLLRQAAEGGYFGLDAASKPLLHLWSLSIEEQFYLLWSVLLLGLSRIKMALTLPCILGVLLASLAFCIVLTPHAPVAAFYLPWARVWELALGALLAYREVFLLSRLPYPARNRANLGAGLGVLAMISGFLLFDETQLFPGWRALIPTLGCSLVIAHPGSWVGERVLGNRLAFFFGLISYPLYLWHWPLFAYAHIRPGIDLTPALMFKLAGLAVVLATATYWLIELPFGVLFRRFRYATALFLLAGLAATGVAGRRIYDTQGVPDRFPPLVSRIFTFNESASSSIALNHSRSKLTGCLYDRSQILLSQDQELQRLKDYFSSHGCINIEDPGRPTILVVGDSHGAHLLAGLVQEFGEKANVLALTVGFCVPLIENVELSGGEVGTPRCKAANAFIFQKIRSIKPTVLIVGAYFNAYDNLQNWRYPDFIDRFVENVHRLHADGIRSIIVAGQVPTWSPSLPMLVGREILEQGSSPEFSTTGMARTPLALDHRLASEKWGDGVRYISQTDKLCGPAGCRRLTGSDLPSDMMAVDYGHYSKNGSIFAIRTIFAPVIADELAQSGR